MPSKSKVCFFFEKRGFNLRDRNRLKDFIEHIFRKEKKKLESINYIFCSDRRLLAINRQFLKHDFYTDIITFDLSEGEKIIAEIYISIDRVIDNAKLINQPFKYELHRVIFHGALHLCGFSDKQAVHQRIMSTKEDLYLSKYFVTQMFPVKPFANVPRGTK
jgi:probable rRNA maturation factor